MKTAQEVRAGNVIMLGKEPMVVQKTEYSQSGRNSAIVQHEDEEPADRFGAGDRLQAPTTSST